VHPTPFSSKFRTSPVTLAESSSEMGELAHPTA